MHIKSDFNKTRKPNCWAFTLIELSIVLIIIGLIVGGVLVGRDLITVSKRRTVLSDKEQMETAVKTFRLKYNCLPGDCRNANNFISGATNGNGNGFVGQRANLLAMHRKG